MKRKRIFTLITIILGFFMALLDTTIVNITLPKMTDYFHTDVNTISWVVNGYNLAFAVVLITASRIADQFGRKKIFMIGVFAFTLTSFLSGISSSVDQLILYRVLQGLSAAFVVPITMPLAMELFPVEKRGAVGGIWGAFAGLAAASGPALGGIISQNFNWQWIFFINIPIGVLCLILSAFLIKESFDPTATKKMDVAGMITLSVSMFSLVLALIQANDKGWDSTYILSLFAVALVGFIVFFIIESKEKEPMLPLELLKIRPFAAGAMTLFMLGIGMMSALFLLAFFLTQMKGLTELQAGLIITASPLTSMVCSSITGPLSDKLGSRWFGVMGMILMALGIYLFSQLTAYSTNMDIIWRLIVVGAGMGSTMAPLMGATVKAVPKNKIGMSSGITNMTRTLGTVVGVAVLITTLNHHISTNISSAKDQVVSLINASALNTTGKEQMVKQIKEAKFSRESQMPTEETILGEMKKAEQDALSKVPPQMQERVKAQFAEQEKIMKDLYPQIQNTFKSSLSAAFSSTFKQNSYLLMIGILLAAFSDPMAGRKKREKGQVAIKPAR